MEKIDLRAILNRNLNTELTETSSTSPERVEVCEGCGDSVKIMMLPVLGGADKGKIKEFRQSCKCTDRPLAEEAQKAHERAVKNKALELFDRYSLIPPELQNACFENYTPNNKSTDYAMRLLKRFAKIYKKDDPKNLLVYGSYGVGKSHLCVALQKALMEKGQTCIFVFFPDLLDMFTDSYNNKSALTEGEIMTALKTTDVLVLDDIGADGTIGDFGLRKLASIVNARQGSSTIYTSNFGPEQLYDVLGERIFSRIMNQNTEECEVDGPNHRLKKYIKSQEAEDER